MQRGSLCLLICMRILFPLKQSASQCAGRSVLLSMVEEIMTPLISVLHNAFFKTSEMQVNFEAETTK